MTAKIAMVGLGAMGFAMAKRLVERQHRVAGYDVRPDAVTALEAAGGHGAASAAGAATDADTVIVLVVSADQVDAVLFDGGVVEAAKPGAHIVVMATCPPARIEATAARVEAAGRRFVDAPVSGGVPGIEAGTLTIMVGAAQETFDSVSPLLRSIGSNLHHVGTQAGQGAAMKTVNQLLAGVHIAAAGEALALAEQQGIAPATALEILSNSAAQSWMLRDRGPRMVAPGGEVRSAVEIFVKDLGIVLDAGTAARFALPLSAAAHQMFLAASGQGRGRDDDSAVIDAYRCLNGGRTGDASRE